jgi:hypothetical protein
MVGQIIISNTAKINSYVTALDASRLFLPKIMAENTLALQHNT